MDGRPDADMICVLHLLARPSLGHSRALVVSLGRRRTSAADRRDVHKSSGKRKNGTHAQKESHWHIAVCYIAVLVVMALSQADR